MSQKKNTGTRVLVLYMLKPPAMHVESTCIHVLIKCPKKTTQGTCVLVLYVLNQPTTHVESTCIRVLIECTKTNTGALMLCAEITQTRMLEQHRHWTTHVHPVSNSRTFD